MELASGCIICLGKTLWDPMKQQVQYIKDLKENVHHLQSEWKELLVQETDVIQQVDNEKKQLMNISNQNVVDHWLENVKGLQELVERLEKEFQEDKRCLNGCLPNFNSRRKLGKETKSLIREAQNLIEKKPFINADPNQVRPASLGIPAEPFKGAAAEKASNSILNCLINEEIAKIGVYGMGGVGKTTIMKNIKNSLLRKNIFTEIVFVTVSRCPDLKTIQKAIADQIDLKLDRDYNEEIRSTMLHEALQRRKKILLILDDLWNELSLKDVGIPEPHVHCKVVLTTRLHSVCKSMGTQEEIKVELLSQADAWSFFQENAHMDDPQLENIAKQVVKECGGLPLAIKTVGRALCGENDVGVWRNALNQLKGSTADIIGMEKGVFDRLKFSFDRLRNEILKACFLYCSLFPEDYKINENELIDHWIWDGLIHQMDNKQDEVDNGKSLLSELKRACMLEFDDDYDTIKMHDMMRDMAINITRHNPHFMVKAGLRLEEAPAENEWTEDVERISLMYNSIETLSGQPRCLRLRTLLLNGNYSLSKIIPHSFFDNMCNLRVLDLSFTRIEMLPDSICNLEKLHVLLLNYCKSLQKVPSLAKLKELRVLGLSGADRIEELPESLSDLKNLEELNLSKCRSLRIVPFLANLKKLKKLHLTCTRIEELPESLFDLKNLEELNLSGFRSLRMVPFLAYLKKLKKLHLTGTHIEELPESLSSLQNLEELNLSKCSKLKTLPSLENLMKLKKLYLTHTCIKGLPQSLSNLEKLCELRLECNKYLEMVPSLAKLMDLRKLDLSVTYIEELPESLSDLKNLHELHLSYCENLKRVPSLVKVEQLRILDLSSTGIEELPKGMERLVALEILDLSDTIRLRRFPHGILPMLSSLKKFSTKGSSCLLSSNEAGMMEGRIDCNEIAGLTRLTDASFDCDDLTSFLTLLKSLQEKVWELRAFIKSCQPPTSEFEHKTSFVGFDGRMGKIKIIEYHDIICFSDILLHLGSMLLPKLTKIEVNAWRPTLRNLFSLQLLKSIQTLESIVLVDCDTMEELIEGDDDETGERIVLPMLKELKLINLPALERISNKPLVCNLLRWIEVEQCPHLKKFPLRIDNLRSVEMIMVKECNTMEGLIVGEDDEIGEQIVLSKIQSLKLINLLALERISSKPLVCNSLILIETIQCPRLKKFSLCIDSLQSVQTIKVEECNIMKELIARDADEIGKQIVLPKLEDLKLINLPAFERIDNKLLVCKSQKKIKITQCPRLKKFPLCINSLQSVKRIIVEQCNMMEDLIAGDDDEIGEQIVLPKMQSLELINLPRLERISSKPLVCNSLEKIKIKQCPHLKKFPLCINSLQSIATIKVQECNMMEELMTGDDEEASERIILSKMQSLELINLPALEIINSKPLVCNSLEKIKIEQCSHLKKLPLHINSLQSIKTIKVQECNTMEELTAADDDETSEQIILPKLEVLMLINLPSLERFSGKPLVCNSLAEIKIIQCLHLKKFPLCIDGLHRVETIKLQECNAMEELTGGDDDKTSDQVLLPNLRFFTLINLPALERISSTPLVCNPWSLSWICIKQCPRLNKISLCIIDSEHQPSRPFFSGCGCFEGKKEWWDALNWHDPTNTKLLLQPFFFKEEEEENARNLIETGEG